MSSPKFYGRLGGGANGGSRHRYFWKHVNAGRQLSSAQSDCDTQCAAKGKPLCCSFLGGAQGGITEGLMEEVTSGLGF